MSRASAKKRLWVAFAEFIKLRDSPNGYAECISCGKRVPYPNKSGHLHAGHFYPRSTTYNALYFDETNVQSQCSHCNFYLGGNIQEYTKGLVKKYGEGVLEELELKKITNRVIMYEYEYKELAAHYRKLNKEMKKERGL